MIEEFKQHLLEFEGLKTRPYHCTSGKLTLGVGRNLDDVGITEEEAMYLLNNDVNHVIERIQENWPWYNDLPLRAKLVMADLAFNMGIGALSTFRNMLTDLKESNWEGAARNLLDSKYAAQVGRRAIYNASLLEKAEEELPSKPQF
tara:strand:+ start:11629 stop:12066 length:438 start_codon:yes stop_codon:yes gene_type:complete